MKRADDFIATLIETNKQYSFYVDWDKVSNNVEVYRDELALLSNLSLSETDPFSELKRLILNYPKVIELIPLLLAFRPEKTKYTATVLEDDKETITKYDFSSQNMNEEKVEKAVHFARKTGLLQELSNIENIRDYYFGVETGMDTNARKNRSGIAMELLIEEHVRDLIKQNDDLFLKQTTFRKAAKEFNVEIPQHNANKKGDFMIFVNNTPINIEVNYFDGGGSKQEIMNSYISRAEDLNNAGWKFALVTDGPGWLKNKNQIETGYERIGNIFNVKMCKDGELNSLKDD
jgi:type II restriction enzyme